MKFLILLEGKSEKNLLDIIIEEEMLSIPILELLDERIFLKRKIDQAIKILISQLDYEEKVKVLLIGDTLRQNFEIPKDLSDRIVSVERFCTKPEIEILIIINEGLWTKFCKTNDTPKNFCKSNVSHNGKNYKVTTDWQVSYFSKMDIKTVLEEYKRLKKHRKDELYLVDILK